MADYISTLMTRVFTLVLGFAISHIIFTDRYPPLMKTSWHTLFQSYGIYFSKDIFLYFCFVFISGFLLSFMYVVYSTGLESIPWVICIINFTVTKIKIYCPANIFIDTSIAAYEIKWKRSSCLLHTYIYLLSSCKKNARQVMWRMNIGHIKNLFIHHP